MSFQSTDLAMSDDALNQITSQLANNNNPDPITDAITRASQKVTDYTLRYNMPVERVNRLVRILTLWDLYSNPALGTMPPNIDKAYTDAMKELQDIRDGKFHDLQLANPPDPNLALSQGQFGSTRHTSFSRGAGEHIEEGG